MAMSDTTHKLDAEFVDAKRRELTNLREALRKAADTTELEESNVKDALAQQPREFEDDAQKLDTLEREGTLVNRTVVRLARVDRALAKIDAGTYGFSDISGERIPVERLNAIPEAINTIGEQENNEHRGSDVP
jgi:DnaK suppressor protein